MGFRTSRVVDWALAACAMAPLACGDQVPIGSNPVQGSSDVNGGTPSSSGSSASGSIDPAMGGATSGARMNSSLVAHAGGSTGRGGSADGVAAGAGNASSGAGGVSLGGRAARDGSGGRSSGGTTSKGGRGALAGEDAGGAAGASGEGGNGASGPDVGSGGGAVIPPPRTGDPYCSPNACQHGASCLEPTNHLTCICEVGGMRACETVRFRSLGQLPETNQTFGRALSDDGSTIVGRAYPEPGPNLLPAPETLRAFRWTLATGLTELRTGAAEPSQSRLSEAYAVSANGAVVAAMRWGPDTANFLWEGGTARELALLQGVAGEGSDLSADGTTLIGGIYPELGFRGYLWTAAGGSELLPLLGDDTVSYARVLSGDGRVVVGLAAREFTVTNDESSTTTYDYRPMRWDPSGASLLPIPKGETEIDPTAINDDGSVVLGFSNRGIPVIWKDGKVSALPGDVYPMALSADGTTALGAESGADIPLIATVPGEFQRIQDLLTLAGVDLSDWSLVRAFGVSADGKVIAGDGWCWSANRQETWIAWLD